MPTEGGTKQDIGKLRMDLLPVGPIEKVALAYTIGAQKYAERNWENGIKWSRCYGAMLRHIFKWWAGEYYDQQDGQHHLSAVAFYCLALLQYHETHQELDDRPKKQTAPTVKAEASGLQNVAEHLSSDEPYTPGEHNWPKAEGKTIQIFKKYQT